MTSTPVVIALTTAAFLATVLLAWLVLSLRRGTSPEDGEADELTPSEATHAGAPEQTAAASLRSIRGIGPATEARLREHGIESVDDLANLDFEAFEELRRAIGRRPEQMSWIAEARRLSPTGKTEPEIT